jgi:hypothetical protein
VTFGDENRCCNVVEVWFFVARVWPEVAFDLRGSDYAISSGFIFVSKC